jgi:tRNA dimethylallyltransferase
LESTVGGLADRIALVGPTASGKTAVGIELARRLGAEIISADSVQVYRYLDIGTAKPTGAEQARAVFHALDVTDPDQDWTLADFQGLGERLCAEIAARGNVPLIVGGTGLYVRALTTRLDLPAVPPDEDLRARWREFARAEGNAALLSALARVDPETAARLHVNDVGRQIRALEVFALSGKTLTELHAENRARQVGDAPRLFGLSFEDRGALYARIDTRVDQMLADGLLDEVRALLARGYSAGLKPMASLGYRQMNAFLAGGCGWEAAVAAMKQETRRFARRQMIWFRADARIRWVEAGDRPPTDIADEIRREIDTPPPRVGLQEGETP